MHQGVFAMFLVVLQEAYFLSGPIVMEGDVLDSGRAIGVFCFDSRIIKYNQSLNRSSLHI
jgi:hypothetical protein